jgi:uncharacterized linocin/CFP29 family protein
MSPVGSVTGPLAEAVWNGLAEAMMATARHALAARRVATFDGPRGWEHVASQLGVMTTCATREGLAAVCLPDVALLAEIRADFHLPWAAVRAFERGAPALDTSEVEKAAHEVALAEDRIAFYGEPVGHGFLTSPDSPRVRRGEWSRPGQAVRDLVSAVAALDGLGVAGPYEAVLPPAAYYAYHQATAEGGAPARALLKGVLAAVHRSEVIRGGGAVFSTRGGDFILTVGGDLTLGYAYHDRDAVHLFCAETVTPRLVTPTAVCLFEG